jgi:O-antigen ligase
MRRASEYSAGFRPQPPPASTDEVAESRSVASHSVELRALGVLLWLLTLRPVAPSAYDLITQGRPAPGTIQALSSEGRYIGLVLTVLIIGTCGVLVTSRRSTTLHAGAAIWSAYLLLAVVSTLLSGALPVVSAATSFVVLVAVGGLRRLPESTIRLATRPLLFVIHASLAMAAALPTTAKFGNVHASWFSRDARLAGLLDQPNQMGLLAGFTTILLLSRLGGRGRWRLLHLTAALLALALSASYTSWIATLAAAIVLWSARQARTRRSALLAPLAVALGVALFRLLSARFAAEGSLTTVSGRREVWDFVLREWQDRPLLGHGSAAWGRLTTQGLVDPWAVHAHNQVLNTLYVGGILGLLALALALATSIVVACRRWKSGVALPLALLSLQAVRSYSEVPFELVFGGLNLLYLVLILVATDAGRPPVERRSGASSPLP